MTEIIFFEHNPFMSVELLDLLDNLTLVCYNDDSTYRNLLTARNRVQSYCNTDAVSEPESDEAVRRMLEDRALIESLKAGRDVITMFFYMNARMEKQRQMAGLPLALPAFPLQEQLGDKRNLAALCGQLGIRSNTQISTLITHGDTVDFFLKCAAYMGLPFIVQGADGESGNDTHLIHNADQFKEVIEGSQQGIRAARYVQNNIPLSTHLCLSNHEITCRGPWPQLIGFKELSASPFRFCGNATSQSLLTSEAIASTLYMSQLIGAEAYSLGYRGILGIDFLWDRDLDIVYPQEINSRLVGATRLLTGIQVDQGLRPDLLHHLEVFTTLKQSTRGKLLTDGFIDGSLEYSQLIIRNNTSETLRIITQLSPGIYKVVNGCLVRRTSSMLLRDVRKDEVLVTYGARQEGVVPPDYVLARIILKTNVLRRDEYALSEDAIVVVNCVRRGFATTPNSPL